MVLTQHQVNSVTLFEVLKLTLKHFLVKVANQILMLFKAIGGSFSQTALNAMCYLLLSLFQGFLTSNCCNLAFLRLSNLQQRINCIIYQHLLMPLAKLFQLFVYFVFLCLYRLFKLAGISQNEVSSCFSIIHFSFGSLYFWLLFL